MNIEARINRATSPPSQSRQVGVWRSVGTKIVLHHDPARKSCFGTFPIRIVSLRPGGSIEQTLRPDIIQKVLSRRGDI